MSDTSEVGVKFSAQIDGLKESMQQAADEVKKQTDTIKGHFETLIGGIEKFKSAFVALAAITAGTGFMKEAVNSTKEFHGEITKMSKLLGSTATEASYFVEAVKMVGGNTEQAETAIGALTRTLRTTPEKFDQLGVATREANGEFRPMQDILLDVNEKFKKMEDGTGKNVAMAAIFGRQWTSVGAALKITKEGLEEAKDEAEALGLVVTKQSQQDVAEYKVSMASVKAVLEGLTKTIGDAFMPILTEMGNWFKEIGPAAVLVMHHAVGLLADAFWILRNGVVVLWETLNAFVNTIAIPIEALGKALYKLVHGDFKGAQEEMTGWPAKVAEAWDMALTNMEASSAKTAEKIKNNHIRGDDVAKKEGQVAPDLSKDPKQKAPSQVGDWERINKTNKDGYQLTHDLRERDLSEDVTYWQSKLALANVGNGDRLKVEEKVAQAQLAVMKKNFTDGKAMREEDVAASEKTAIDGLALTKAKYEQDFALGKITQAQLIQLDMQQEDQKLAIQRTAQMARIQMAADDPSQNTAALQAQKDKLLEIERAYQVARANLQTKAAVEDAKYGKQFEDGMASGFNGVIKNFAQGTMTIQNLFLNMGRAVLTAFTDIFAQIAAKWLANKVMQEVGAKVSSLAQIAGNAAVAGSAAFASTAAIPITGPALAPEVAAAAYSGAMSFATMPGFEVGSWNVPGDMFTKVHAGETILNPGDASKFRTAVDGMGGAGGDSGPIHIYGTPDDTIKLKDLGRVLKQMNRNFEFAKR